MTLRGRLTLVATGVVAVVVAAASLTTYFVMRHQLWASLDQRLAQQWTQVQQNPQLLHAFDVHDFGQPFQLPSGGPRATSMYMQAVSAAGLRALTRGENEYVPVSARTLAVAAGTARPYFTNAKVGGVRSRVYTVRVQPGIALQFVQPTDDVVRALTKLRLILLLVFVGSIGAAALGGALVSRATLAPVRRLTAAAGRIAKTGDPSERVPETGRGELALLASSFNTMLAALEESLETQRRFVADASHELRTPLTSLQTNLDVLRQQEKLAPDARQRLLDDLHRESQEMRALISGLLELARGDDPRLEKRELAFDELVESTLERARSRFPNVTWEAELEPTTVDGYPERLDRAVWNLLENAGKWSGEGSSVEVTLRGGELRVRDYGPGIAPEERALVFDRFYRSAAARAMPGSGLGLAIVREVAEAHGGTVTAEEAPGGGALMRLSLNGAVLAPAAS
jgi:two-component system sensor histidine kinase MprB